MCEGHFCGSLEESDEAYFDEGLGLRGDERAGRARSTGKQALIGEVAVARWSLPHPTTTSDVTSVVHLVLNMSRRRLGATKAAPLTDATGVVIIMACFSLL